MGTQVITRDSGRRLGVVGEVVVDIDRREVVALGLRDNPLTRFLPGLPRWMPLDRIRQVGDVILVDSADSLSEGFNPERYTKVINCQVITEAGEQLGRVLGFSFDIETGELATLVIGAVGVPLLGEGVLSTWELTVEEIVSSGPDRIIVYEGAEEKLKQLGTGLLEKLGIGGPSWEQEERERFRTGMVPVENQLAAGQASVQEQRRIQPATSRAFEPEEELEYVELEERRQQEPLRQRRYLDDEPETRSREGRYQEGRFQEDRDQQGRYQDDRYQEGRYQNEPYQDQRSPQERSPQDRYPVDGYPTDRYPENRFPENRSPENQYPEERYPEERSSQERYPDQRQQSAPRRAPEPRRPAAEPQPEPRRETSRETKREPIDVEAEDLGDPW
ncbi:MAG: PRC-barrel domain-containing protein [Cyanobium sp. LacPavin_0920_WC12_MAG_62_9]|nr:PRC-barrel domain-containing protein [Cyanobium sp. LacPavin_0920_WC12_MAG_62_9]